ncbi:MAG TPA: efflux RND transporter periplasmic adaptor subunit [Gemmatimonadales bacterium]|nr:efflux RND transporter periplasmic adaptor subunit [Gemmatimonadales bacterium]
MTRRISLPRPLLALVALGSACGTPAAPPPDIAAPTVATAVARTDTFVTIIPALGRVAARDGFIARLGAPQQSRVTAVHVSQGDRVTAGAPLVSLDLPAFRAQLESATARLDAAEAAWQRAVRLERDGLVAQRDVEQRAADLAAARAESVNSHLNAERAELRSPITGVVASMTATLGATVDPGTVLVEVVDPDRLEIVLDVPPDVARQLQPGMQAVLRSVATNGDSLGIGVVRTVSPLLDAAGGTVRVRLRVASGHAALRLGESVQAAIVAGRVPDAIVVPIDALVPEGDSFIVYTVDADGMVHHRPVRVAGRNAALASISAGLNVGERVVTTGAYGMVDSTTVGIAP